MIGEVIGTIASLFYRKGRR